MINLMSFYYKPSFEYQRKDSLEQIKSSFIYHIDGLNQYGWNPENTILKTNFSFQHKNITATPFLFNKDLCNLFFSKIIAAYEVLKKYPNTVVWQHDHDTFQLKPFVLPINLTHDITMCSRWKGNTLANSASIFYNGLSQTIEDLYEFIQGSDLLLSKAKTDEDIFIYFQELGYSISTNLSFEYNTSLTKYTSHRRKSIDPYCVHGDPFRRKWDKKKFDFYLSNGSFPARRS